MVRDHFFLPFTSSLLTIRKNAEDLKETKERLTSEIEALTRQITRKERLQEEALARARTAEGALAALQKEHGDFKSGVKRKVKELEDGAKMAEETKTRTEREYLALRDGVRFVSRDSLAHSRTQADDSVQSDAGRLEGGSSMAAGRPFAFAETARTQVHDLCVRLGIGTCETPS